MKRFLSTSWMIPLLWLSACATTHPGKMATLLDTLSTPSALVSAEVQSGFSDDHYTFVTFTVENKSDRILRIQSAELEPNVTENGKPANVLVGPDLVAWAEAYDARAKQKEHNQEIAQLALVIGGAALGIVGSAADNKTLALLGAGTSLGGAAWNATTTIQKAVRSAKNPAKVPEQHIYAPFSVPAGMFVRKWAVLDAPATSESLKRLKLNLVTEDAVESHYAIALQ